MRSVNQCPGCCGAHFNDRGTALAGALPEAKRNSQFRPFTLRECGDCGLYFKSEVLEDYELKEFYAQSDFEAWESPRLYPPERTALVRLKSLPAGARILDFGCATGRLLEAAGNSYQRFGVEINDRSAAIATAKGITIVTAQSLESAGPIYDAIVLSDVIEHLTHPTEMLRAFRKCLRSGGLLLVMTGNADAKEAQADLANFWYLASIQHLCMINRKYLNYACESLGYELSEWIELSHYDTPLHQRAYQWLRTWAYRSFHVESYRHWRPLANVLPVVRRAKHWKLPPPLTCTADHVVAIMRAQ